ncbi:MAG: diguanylate cyclase [Thioalkalivibrionaceae bacterium]
MNQRSPCGRNVRHDLRTPIHQIIGYAELIEEDLDPDAGDARVAIEAVVNATRRLLSIIDNGGPVEQGPIDVLFPNWRASIALVEQEVAALRNVFVRSAAGQLNDIVSIERAASALSLQLRELHHLGSIDLRGGASEAAVSVVRSSSAEEAMCSPTALSTADARLLVVDDDPESCELLRRRLLREGHRVDVAHDGDMALRRIKEGDYDVVLLDWIMPGRGGLDILRAIRAEHSATRLPVIVVTARRSSATIVEALEAGANDYVAKPFDFAVVLARIGTQRYIRDVTRQLENANDQLHRFSYIDGLTGIANRRRFDEVLRKTWQAAQTHRHPVSLILIDVDYFKRFNDCLGHEAGDQCLQRVAQTLAAQLFRSRDLAARYGGEEFAIILPETGLDDARQVAERLRLALEAMHIDHPARDDCAVVTASFGVGCWHPTSFCDPFSLIRLADQALYSAKNGGRNRVSAAGPGPGDLA